MTDPHRVEEYDVDLLRDLYRTMRRIREFELELQERSTSLPGPVHLYLGQEAVATGTCLALGDGDIIGSTHRGHGHLIAMGAEIEAMMAEIGGKETGLNGGRGGSMHLVDYSLDIFGCNAIVGASMPHVLGGVLSADLDEKDRVGVAFFGEGGINQGVVAESMNLAGIWDLPVIFLCENNQYAVGTSVDYAMSGDRVSDRAAGYGIDGQTVDGQDVFAVYEAVSAAVETAREIGRPALIECDTYRYSGHFAGHEDMLEEDNLYRSTEEIEAVRENRDPLTLFADRVTGDGPLDKDKLAAIDEEVETEIADAAAAMEAADYPPAARALENVYANQDYPEFPAGRYR